MIATAASALLVASVLSKKATGVVKDHELVDLGDEALLRGWTLADQIAGLEDDLLKLSGDTDFIEEALSDNPNLEKLKQLAKQNCHRYWNRHLRIDLCESKAREVSILEEKATLRADDSWFPGQQGAVRNRIHLSPIRRAEVSYKNFKGVGPMTRWEPVVTAVAPIFAGQRNAGVVSKRLYLRILTSLDNGKSPRHFFYMESEDHTPLVRHDDNETKDPENAEIFEGLHKRSTVKEALEKALEKKRSEIDDNPDLAENPKVTRLIMTEPIPLKKDYYFLEGLPNEKLEAAMESSTHEGEKAPFESEDEFNLFLEKMVTSCEETGLGRVGGLSGGVKEVRLLAQSRENIRKLQEKVEKMLRDHYKANFDGISWRGRDWRDAVSCTKIHASTVLLFAGQGPEEKFYLLHYCVMDEELASAIAQEMKTLKNIAMAVAVGFGMIGFLIAMFFIRPLKKMTVTAQKITESHPDQLFENLSDLARDLDIKRRDEVGDIARSSKRLFEELITFHEQLEQRVEDRTRELRKANIELEQAYEQLMSLSHEKDAFVAKVSHDLRQPLNAIFLQVEALKLSDLDETQREDVQRIYAHARRELNLVNDILEYQKIIMGAETLVKSEIDIPTLITDIAEAHRPTAEAKGLKFKAVYDDEIGSLTADDQRLHQVLGNLVGNACKFTKEGTISLNAHAREISGEPWIEFTITDTGRGMSPAEQSKVFVPFVSNKKDNAGGTGLGLSICKELTGQMGGKIGFVSELDKGTHFSVFLPRAAASQCYEENKPKEKLSPVNQRWSDGEGSGVQKEKSEIHEGGGTILVIDDDENVRQLLSRLLREDGYHVLTAEDGISGLKMAHKHLPDAITLDVVMPGGKDGWEVLKNLKESPETESIPVIMVSVMAADGNSVALDVEDCLVKPIDIQRLSRVMSRVTSQSPQRNILLVDDDRESLQTLSQLLDRAGWKTTLANNGKEAISVLERTLPAAIVLDLMMPEMDGFEFLRRIQEEPGLRDIPVVVMTGKVPSRDEETFLRDHVATILTKGEASGGDLLRSIREKIRGST